MARTLSPVDRESRDRFARLVERIFAESSTTEYQQGFDSGSEHARRVIEQVALRAGLSSEVHAEKVEQVLRCVLAKIDRESLDKPSKVS